ncbi:MAG: HDOD domain-containing protein [Syntrophales bacterium]
MDVQVLRSRVENINTLPTIPGVLKHLSAIIENPKVSLSEISHFVSNDPSLTTKVLKMVNSAVYGFPGRISSVTHAIMLLGLNVVKGLLLGISVFEVMQKAMLGLREHSLGCAVTARLIAQKKGLKEPEEVSVGALLHDIGKVILALEFPAEYESAMNTAQTRGIPIVEAEKTAFPEAHAAVGAWLAQKWRFPRGLVDMIEYHHCPNLSKSASLETAIVHFSDVLVHARGLGFAGDDTVAAVDPAAFELLRFSQDDIKEILRGLEDSIESSEEPWLDT